MAYTRAQLEGILIKRVGAWLTFVSLDGVTHAGANPDLNDPLVQALQYLSYSVADITNVSSTDLAAVSDANIPKLLALAEYYSLGTILQNFTKTDVSGLNYSKKAGQFGERVAARLEALRLQLLTQYGVGVVSAAPYVGGISIADKETQEQDTDRAQPAFRRNEIDQLLPFDDRWYLP